VEQITPILGMSISDDELDIMKQELRSESPFPSRFQAKRKSLFYLTKDKGTCTPGHNPKRDGCTPATGSSSNRESSSSETAKEQLGTIPERVARKVKKAPPPPGEKIAPTKHPYTPDPTKIQADTGLPCCARVGVPAMSAPPPPKLIPRLDELTERERAVESRFADAYLKDHEKFLDDYQRGRNHVIGFELKLPDAAKFAAAAKEKGIELKVKHDDKKNQDEVTLFGEFGPLKAFMQEQNVTSNSPLYEIGDAPNIFNTDDAKLLSPDYNPKGVSPDLVKNARGLYNITVHQTANALAKRAFLKYLDDTVVHLPEDKRIVLVTSGGCAAGKGFALKGTEEGRMMSKEAAAIWDAAGEQNATENVWVLAECEKRGIKPIFAFIHADPISRWENPESGVIERASRNGRMVDGKLYSDSYALGANNFNAFHQEHKNNPNVRFMILDNSKPGTIKKLDKIPEEALSQDSDEIYARVSKVLDERANKLAPAIVRGGSLGRRIWEEAPEVKS
jgi:hypothetical protein